MAADSASGRASAMRRSVLTAARANGVVHDEVALVGNAFDAAMTPRVRTLPDDHHPAYLHPGRSALILLRDVGTRDGLTLAAAMLLESEDDSLRAEPPGALRGEGSGSDASTRLRTELADVPSPGDERLVERLLALTPGLLLATLAERLDHLRHLHLRPDLRSSWRSRHAEVESAWLPMAQRAHPKLATRYGHWTRTFARRL